MSAAVLINSFQADLNNVKDTYTRDLVHPYARAFSRAQTGFNGAIAAKIKADQMGLELTLMAFSLVGGGLLTRVFATSALKEVAAKVSLDIICRNSLERAFSLAAMIEASPTATFILGEIWEQASSLFSEKLKNNLLASAASFPSLSKFQETPLDAYTYLQDFVLDCKIKAHEVASEIRDSSLLSDDQKIQAVNRLKSSRFFQARAPKIDETSLSYEIELAWWMKYLLGLDYMRTSKWDPTCGARTQLREAISLSPSSAAYPRSSSGARNFRDTITEVRYTQLRNIFGNSIGNRIDEVHRNRFGRKFFTESEAVGRPTLLKAERLLNKLGSDSLIQLKSSL